MHGQFSWALNLHVKKCQKEPSAVLSTVLFLLWDGSIANCVHAGNWSAAKGNKLKVIHSGEGTVPGFWIYTGYWVFSGSMASIKETCDKSKRDNVNLAQAFLQWIRLVISLPGWSIHNQNHSGVSVETWILWNWSLVSTVQGHDFRTWSSFFFAWIAKSQTWHGTWQQLWCFLSYCPSKENSAVRSLMNSHAKKPHAEKCPENYEQQFVFNTTVQITFE